MATSYLIFWMLKTQIMYSATYILIGICCFIAIKYLCCVYRKSINLSKRNVISLNTNISNGQNPEYINITSEIVYEEIQDIKPDDYELTTCPAYGINSSKWLNSILAQCIQFLQYFQIIDLTS